MKTIIFIMVLLSTLINAEIETVEHPRGEPKGLFVVTLSTPGAVKNIKYFRLYCPTFTARDITGGVRRKAHKVEDMVRRYGRDFYVDAATVCRYKILYNPYEDIGPVTYPSMN